MLPDGYQGTEKVTSTCSHLRNADAIIVSPRYELPLQGLRKVVEKARSLPSTQGFPTQHYGYLRPHTLYCREHPVCCRLFTNIPGLCSPGTVPAPPLPTAVTASVSRLCQVSSGMRTLPVESCCFDVPYGKRLEKKVHMAGQGQQHFCRIKNVSVGL